MFSYWGDHGLGDYSRLPIGHGKAVEQGNGDYSYIENGGEPLEISTFLFDKANLYAKVDERTHLKGGYLVWNLKSENWERYTDGQYLALVKEKGYPLPEKFTDFSTAYDHYWSGWRFFLLP